MIGPRGGDGLSGPLLCAEALDEEAAEEEHRADCEERQRPRDRAQVGEVVEEDVKTHPVSLPARIETQPVRAVPTVVRGDEWELRCVEVTAADGNWLNVAEAKLGRTDQLH